MIIDKIENISNYVEIPNCLADTVKSLSKDAECARQILQDYPNVICRLIIEADKTENGDATIVFESVDHLKQFEEYALSNIGDNDIVREELLNVIK